MRAIISGGGTGGHIFPALAIANALKRRDAECEILFVGAKGRMEMERVPAAGYKIEGLEIAGFDRRRLWRNFSVLLKLWRSRRRAGKIIREFNPDVVVGVGGYASGPTLMKAQSMGIPTLVQEQNSYAGVTNKMLGRKAKRVCVAYDGMDRFFPGERVVLTGNPVREVIANCDIEQSEAKKRLGFEADKPLVVVVGGSLGARTINDTMKGIVDDLLKAGIQVLWQTGRLYADECKPTVEGKKGVVCSAFVTQMELAYAAADLVVSRAGASTISELQVVGVPAILVPSPNVAEDHQRKNAMALVKDDAAVMVLDSDCRGALKEQIIGLLNDKERLDTLRNNVKHPELKNADETIVDNIYQIVAER